MPPSSGDRAYASLNIAPDDESQAHDHEEMNEASGELEAEPENGPGHDKDDA
jgi:hypothetical protein